MELEHRFETPSSYETTVETLPNQTAHTDGPKVIEVQTSKKTPRLLIMDSRGLGYPGCLNVMAKRKT
jgi:hypothetical protein